MQGAPEDHRNRQEGHSRHPGREPHHGGTHGQHGGDQLQDRVGALVKKALELVDVVVENGQEAAAEAGLEESHVQALEVSIPLDPQLVLHGLGKVAPEEGVEVFEEGFRAPHQERQNGKNSQLAWNGGHAETDQHGSVAVRHHIDR